MMVGLGIILDVGRSGKSHIYHLKLKQPMLDLTLDSKGGYNCRIY